mmetsp:Transcript_15630/g.44493  ORF Transcript_15630/g.44493 Transcript_15630/m.44493 type:complete len:245 (+) Transcript_15630:509-1243(+)
MGRSPSPSQARCPVASYRHWSSTARCGPSPWTSWPCWTTRFRRFLRYHRATRTSSNELERCSSSNGSYLEYGATTCFAGAGVLKDSSSRASTRSTEPSRRRVARGSSRARARASWTSNMSAMWSGWPRPWPTGRATRCGVGGGSTSMLGSRPSSKGPRTRRRGATGTRTRTTSRPSTATASTTARRSSRLFDGPWTAATPRGVCHSRPYRRRTPPPTSCSRAGALLNRTRPTRPRIMCWRTSRM